MPTGLALMEQLLDELPGEPSFFQGGLGKKVTLATITTTTVTITTPGVLGLGSNINPNLFLGTWIFLDANNEIRELGTCAYATQTLTIQLIGANATTSGTPTTGYILRVDPALLLNLFNDVLKDNTCECFIPLYHGPTDADMQDSDTVDASWTESGASDSLVTTAAHVFAGARMLQVTDSGSGGGRTRSGSIPMGMGEQGWLRGIFKSNSGGTVGIRVLDAGGNTIDTVNTTQGVFVSINKPFTVDSSDKGALIDLLVTTASGVGDFQQAGIVRAGISRFNLPNWVLERYQVKALSYATFPDAGSEENTWLAESMELKALDQDRNDFRFIRRPGDANPNAVWVDPRWLSYPLFVTVLCPWTEPYGVSATFSTFDSSTSMQADIFVAYAKWLIGRRWAMFAAAGEQGRVEYEEALAKRSTPPPPSLNFTMHPVWLSW